MSGLWLSFRTPSSPRLMGLMSLSYRLRVCWSILTNHAWDVARRGVYSDSGLIVIAFGPMPEALKHFGGGRTISVLKDGTEIEVRSPQ